MISDVVNYLGVEKTEVTEFHSLGIFNSMATQSRQKLVKFQTSYYIDKILARASMLKNFEPGLNDFPHKVYIAKTLNREQKLLEQKLLKKRRKLTDVQKIDAKSITLRNGTLFVHKKAYELNDSVK